MILEWGDPVQLPHRADALFRAITETGVHPMVAAEMIQQDRARIARIIQLYKAGALAKPRSTVAALIVGAFRDEKWDFQPIPVQEQMDLLDDSSSVVTTPPRQSINPDSVLDWEELRTRSGDCEFFEGAVLVPVLAAAGESNPGRLLGIPEIRDRVRRSFDRLGWPKALDVVYRAAGYLFSGTIEKPCSYLASALENAARNATEDQAIVIQTLRPSARLAPASPIRVAVDFRELKIAELRSWLDVLNDNPTRQIAEEARAFVYERRLLDSTDPEIAQLAREIELQAEQALAKNSSAPHAS